MSDPKPSLWSKVQTYLIVTVISSLIWLYAESENVKQQKPLPFDIQFVAPTGQRLVIDPVTPQQVWLTVRCATGQYDELKQLRAKPIRLTINAEPANPRQVIILRERLEDTPIGQLGVDIVDLRPTTVNVRVERLVRVTVPIAPESVVPKDVLLTAPPILDPDHARLSLPASVAGSLGDVRLDAPLDPETLTRLDENLPHDRLVAISLPRSIRNAWWAHRAVIEPSTTRVSFTIRKQTDTIELTSVPILILAPWSELNRYSVNLEGNKRVLDEDVELTGPSDVIDRVRKGELKVWAELRLSAGELDSGITSKPLHLHVPTGVRVDSTLPRANFTLTDRSPPAR